MKRILFLLFFLLLFCSQGFADIIVLKNGDRLTGKVVRLEQEGKLLFKSDMLGDITLDISKIKNFKTDEPIEIHLQDGTVMKAKVTFDGEGLFKIEKEEKEEPRAFAVKDVKKINPRKVVWSGNLTIGFNSSKADSLDESLAVDATIRRRTEKSRTRLESFYFFARERDVGETEKRTTDDNFTLDFHHKQFFKKKIYGFVNSRYKKDNVELLSYRVVAGLGGGYQWIDIDKIKFSTEGGLAYLKDLYKATNPNTGLQEDTEKEEPSLNLGYDLELAPIKRVNFLSKLKYYPSLKEFSDYFLNWDAELQITLRRPVFGTFKTIFEYDSSPADRASNTDVKYLIGVGVKF